MLLLLGFIAVVLTLAMFLSRNAMLSFPSAIFWFAFGTDCYILSAAMWDIYYIAFFASCIGMTVFCILAGFGLREKRDTGTDEDEYIDEKGGGNERYLDETSAQARRANASGLADDLPPDSDVDAPSRPSRRTVELHKRARERKTNGAKRRFRWGEFK